MASNWTDKGGYLSFARLSAKLRYRTLPMMPLMKFVREEPTIGGKKGDTVNITRIYNANTQYPTSPLSENAPIPITDWTQDQFSVKVQEWGQAFDLTEKFERLSDFDPDDITTRLLQDSIAKWGNNIVANKIKQTGLIYMPSTGSVGTATTTTSGFATADLPYASSSYGYSLEEDGTGPSATYRQFASGDLLNLRALAMDIYKIPQLTGEMSNYGEYAFVCSQGLMNTLMLDTNIASALNYAYATNKDGSPFMRGFMGTYMGIQFFLDTQNLSGNTALFFGDDVVAKAEPLAPEIRRKNPLDYGRDKGVAWYGLSGFKFCGGTTNAQNEAYLARAIYVVPATSTNVPTEIAA